MNDSYKLEKYRITVPDGMEILQKSGTNPINDTLERSSLIKSKETADAGK